MSQFRVSSPILPLRSSSAAGPAIRLAAAMTHLLAPATVNRILAAVSSFYDWAVAAEEYDGDSPMHKRLAPALARVPDQPQPFTGRASRQQPTRRTVTVKQPRRLPRPVDGTVLEQFIGSLKRLRDLAVFLLMLDGGLRPGEVLSLHLDDISYGRRRVTVRKRDDHPRGVRGKSRTERVVDLHEPPEVTARTLTGATDTARPRNEGALRRKRSANVGPSLGDR
ncbi:MULTISPECIES: tyrosine-type recombinase/integrase [unclassified Streptomyces]|uniref:tyrosine-type recombinase/integrase n=1 Tax=unclassified Streptomyces TaxID=2593676 RepID=UPI0036679F80